MKLPTCEKLFIIPSMGLLLQIHNSRCILAEHNCYFYICLAPFWTEANGKRHAIGGLINFDEMKATRWVWGGRWGKGGSWDDSIIEKALRLHLSKSHETYGTKVTYNFATHICQGYVNNSLFISMCSLRDLPPAEEP